MAGFLLPLPSPLESPRVFMLLLYFQVEIYGVCIDKGFIKKLLTLSSHHFAIFDKYFRCYVQQVERPYEVVLPGD